MMNKLWILSASELEKWNGGCVSGKFFDFELEKVEFE